MVDVEVEDSGLPVGRECGRGFRDVLPELCPLEKSGCLLKVLGGENSGDEVPSARELFAVEVDVGHRLLVPSLERLRLQRDLEVPRDVPQVVDFQQIGVPGGLHEGVVNVREPLPERELQLACRVGRLQL